MLCYYESDWLPLFGKYIRCGGSDHMVHVCYELMTNGLYIQFLAYYGYKTIHIRYQNAKSDFCVQMLI